MRTTVISSLLAAVALLSAAPALASCRISNQTKHSFTVTSGNTSNQRVGAHTNTSIASGKILAKSDDGKSFGGSCKDGDELVVKEENGVIYLMPKK